VSELVRFEIAAFEKSASRNWFQDPSAAESPQKREDAIQRRPGVPPVPRGAIARLGWRHTRCILQTGKGRLRSASSTSMPDKGGLSASRRISRPYEVREEPTLAIDFRGAQVHSAGAWRVKASQWRRRLPSWNSRPGRFARDGNQSRSFAFSDARGVETSVFADREAQKGVSTTPLHANRPGALLDPLFIADRFAGASMRPSRTHYAPAAPARSFGRTPGFEARWRRSSHVSESTAPEISSPPPARSKFMIPP